MNKIVITRAPEVHLTFWLVRQVGLFTTKSLSIVPKLKSFKNIRFWWFWGSLQYIKISKIAFFLQNSPPARSQTKTTNRLFSKKRPRQGHKQKRQTVFLQSDNYNAKHGKWDGYGPLHRRERWRARERGSVNHSLRALLRPHVWLSLALSLALDLSRRCKGP